MANAMPFDPDDFAPPQEQAGSTTVTIGSVDFTDYRSKFKRDPNEDGTIWTDCMIGNRYEQDKHIYQMGLTSSDGFNGQSCAFVQLSAPTVLWICEWTVCRFGAKPKIPPSEPSDPNWVLLDTMDVTAPLAIMANGVTPMYRISGVYVYGCKNPGSDIKALMSFPRVPWIEDAFDRTVSDDMLMTGLIDRAGASSSIFQMGISPPQTGERGK